nr:MAG TPA: hypothetical protein [Caudoviricetes sp.]
MVHNLHLSFSNFLLLYNSYYTQLLVTVNIFSNFLFLLACFVEKKQNVAL